jgi:acyl-CoA synthetase (NDP forming)
VGVSAGDQFRNLRRLLNPTSIAYIGGARSVAAFRLSRKNGFAGRSYLVNPRHPEIDGEPCFPSVAALPEAPDAAFLVVDAETTIETVKALAARGAGAAVCFASGFAETGAEGAAREERLVAAAGDMALIGPNCYGIVNYLNGGSMWPTEYPRQALPPTVAIISQSGMVSISLTQNLRAVPLTHVISLGNQAGVQIDELIEYYAETSVVSAIGIFLEGLHDVAQFHDACLKALRQGIAVVVLKAGRSEISAEIAKSHTNSLAGSAELYGALFERLGIYWARSIPEMLEALKLFATWRRPAGDRVAFFSTSGGESSMAADFAEAAGLVLPQPEGDTRTALAALLPEYGAVSNPLDFTTALWGDGEALRELIITACRRDIDKAVLVLDFPRPEFGISDSMRSMMNGVCAAREATGVETAIASMKPESFPESEMISLIRAGVLPIQGLELGCQVIAAAARQATRRAAAEAGLIAPLAATAWAAGSDVLLSERESKSILAKAGVPVPRGDETSLAAAGEAAERLGFPVVVKASSRALPHKTEAGAVALDLRSSGDVAAAVSRMRDKIAIFDRNIAFERVLVEKMVKDAVAELFIGVKRDAAFGLALVIGSGGVLVELVRDTVTLLLPTTRAEVETAIRRLAGFRLMAGFRNRPRGDVEALVAATLAVAEFAARHADRLIELDINPLFVRPLGHGVVAADALLRWIE